MGVERNDSLPNAANVALWSSFRITKGNESVGALGALDPWVWVVPEIVRSWSARACFVFDWYCSYHDSVNQATCLEYQ